MNGVYLHTSNVKFYILLKAIRNLWDVDGMCVCVRMCYLGLETQYLKKQKHTVHGMWIYSTVPLKFGQGVTIYLIF